MITEAEKMQFERARRRVNDSELDPLTEESTLNTLTLSETALANAKPENRDVVEAMAGQAIAFSHFASSARKYAIEVSAAAVAAQVKRCKGDKGKNPAKGLTLIKQTLFSNGIALAMVLSTIIWKLPPDLVVNFFKLLMN